MSILQTGSNHPAPAQRHAELSNRDDPMVAAKRCPSSRAQLGVNGGNRELLGSPVESRGRSTVPTQRHAALLKDADPMPKLLKTAQNANLKLTRNHGLVLCTLKTPHSKTETSRQHYSSTPITVRQNPRYKTLGGFRRQKCQHCQQAMKRTDHRSGGYPMCSSVTAWS
ncbi:hypothetical protein B0H12DRAFT_1151452 [Mycena haematopus]|nr:hypothetical protein B0H12DRAFT_1151452 [Mycena haematopus]